LVHPDNLDGLQSLANLRISQNKKEEASTILTDLATRCSQLRNVVRNRSIIADFSFTNISELEGTLP
jgi:hypothetical protein